MSLAAPRGWLERRVSRGVGSGLVWMLAMVLVLAGCAPPTERIDDAWHVIDLARDKPRAEGERAEVAVNEARRLCGA